MSTPFDQVEADPDALRALGRAVMRKMLLAFVVGVAVGAPLGFLAAWLLP